MKRFSLLWIIPLTLSGMVLGQGGITIDHYKRAVGFIPENLSEKVFNLHIQTNWFPDSSGLWYVHQSAESKKYLKIAIPGLQKSELFDHQKLASSLSDSLGEDIDSNDLPLNRIEYKSQTELWITVKGKKFSLNTDDYSLSPLPEKEVSNEFEESSPDDKWIAYVKDYNLYIKSTETEEIKQLSSSGHPGYEYASWYGWADIMEGENGERPKHFGVNWSEDSEWIHANICDLRSAQKMYLLDWSVDTLYRPRLLSYYRGSPGDTAMVYMEPVFFNVTSGREIRPGLPRSTHINSINVEWSATPGKVYLQSMSRGYQNLKLYTFDLQTEQLQDIYAESSNTNIDNFTYQLAEKSGFLFFLSEKSGWRQLYCLDLNTKQEKSISNGEFYIHRIARIDEENQKIFFIASGREKERNPYYQFLYSISFKGEDLRLLTNENHHHQISISPEGDYFADNISTVNVETTVVLRKAEDGAILAQMGKADVTGLEAWNPPQIFTSLAHDGQTTIYGALWKPTTFNPGNKYPIIDNSYTGPHTQVFPTSFAQAFSVQALAELGFIVVKVDGLGSSGRSKQFHDHSYKNLGGGLTDHIEAIRQLGEQYSWIDTSRVGIFGHSAGGYDAGHAVLAYPNFYKVAVASSADHDHRMEKAWWPEMYMGWPVDSSYHLQSNITMAGNLKGKLLITHGGIDENVNPSATFKLAEALIKADKQFDMLILPSQRHGYQGDHSRYFRKIRWNYFVEHLLGDKPIWEFEWE